MLLAHARRDGCHLIWGIAKVEELGPAHPGAGPALCAFPASAHEDLDDLDMRGTHEELHLDARAVDDIAEEEGRVGAAPAYREENASEGCRGVLGRHLENGTREDAFWVSLSKAGEEFKLFGGQDTLGEVGHESLANLCWFGGGDSGRWGDDSDIRIRVRLSRSGHEPLSTSSKDVEHGGRGTPADGEGT